MSIWLLGSKARGEAPGPESDVDLLVLVRDADWRRRGEIQVVAWEAVDATGANEGRFSVLVDTPEWLRGRREIRSFFIQRPQVAVVHHDHLVGGRVFCSASDRGATARSLGRPAVGATTERSNVGVGYESYPPGSAARGERFHVFVTRTHAARSRGTT